MYATLAPGVGRVREPGEEEVGGSFHKIERPHALIWMEAL